MRGSSKILGRGQQTARDLRRVRDTERAAPQLKLPQAPQGECRYLGLGSENSFAHGSPALEVSLVAPTRLQCQPLSYYLPDLV